jgi:hypothetical protein
LLRRRYSFGNAKARVRDHFRRVRSDQKVIFDDQDDRTRYGAIGHSKPLSQEWESDGCPYRSVPDNKYVGNRT